MDRFHGFIEGWKLPRLDKKHIMKGWTLNIEYFSTVLHILRLAPEYDNVFDVLVATNEDCDLRDKKAVKKLTTAYHKLLFPHIHSMEDIAEEDRENFKQLYAHYCLEPAVASRAIIRKQCHIIDKEFKAEMGKFNIQ